MSKDKSLVLKGVAILMMLWLHCFNIGINKAIKYEDVFIGDYPLCDIIARCSSPVSLYILLSGYGLWFTYSRNGHIHVFKRLLKLFVLYWLTILIFIPLGSYKGVYNFDLSEIIYYLLAYKTTFNATLWFLFPYSLLLLFSNNIFKLLRSFPKQIVLYSIVIGIIAYGLSWATIHKYICFPHDSFSILINSIGMLPAFVIGAYMNTTEVITRFVKKYGYHQKMLLCVFLGITFLRCFTEFSFIVHLIYTICIVLFVCAINIPKRLFRCLKFAGTLSTVVWFIHAYLLWYIYGDYFFGLKYPIPIFISIVFVSFLIGWIINKMYLKLLKLLSL